MYPRNYAKPYICKYAAPYLSGCGAGISGPGEPGPEPIPLCYDFNSITVNQRGDIPAWVPATRIWSVAFEAQWGSSAGIVESVISGPLDVNGDGLLIINRGDDLLTVEVGTAPAILFSGAELGNPAPDSFITIEVSVSTTSSVALGFRGTATVNGVVKNIPNGTDVLALQYLVNDLEGSTQPYNGIIRNLTLTDTIDSRFYPMNEGNGNAFISQPAGNNIVVSNHDPANWIECPGVTITTQPASTSARIGGTVAFTVEANSGDDSPLTYQWQYSGDGGVEWGNLGDSADLSGTTTDTVTLTDFDGTDLTQWRCIVSNDHDTVTSDAAILYALPIIFEAPLQSSLIPEFSVGSPTPTFARNSARTIVNYEGIVRTCLAEEAGFVGGRRVHNYNLHSEDFSVTGPDGWAITFSEGTVTTGVTDKDGGLTAARLERTSGVGIDTVGVQSNSVIYGSDPEDHRFSVYARSESGTPAVQIFTNVFDSATVTFPADGEWHRVCGSVGRTQFNIMGGVYLAAGSVGDIVDVCYAQTELVAGNANTAPSEYVSQDAASTQPYHGANVDGVQYFTTQNNSTVSNGVVTENYSTPITSGYYADAQGPYGYISEQNTQNDVRWSEDLTDVVWLKPNITLGTMVGPNGVSGQYSVTATGTEAITQTNLVTSYGGTYSFYIKNVDSIQSAIQDNNYGAYLLIEWAGQTPTTRDSGVFTGISYEEIGNDWWRIRATVPILAGQTVHQIQVQPDYLVAGKTIGMFGFQYESGETSASTYFTTGDSPVTRQADRLTYPSAGNFVGSEGTTLVEYTTFWEDNTPVAKHLINVSQSPETQSLAYWLADYPNLLAIDSGSNFVEAPRSSGANTIIPFSISYGPSGLAMSNDGNLDTDPLYSGDIGTGPNIWIGCQYGGADAGASFMDGTVRNVQIYNEEGQ